MVGKHWFVFFSVLLQFLPSVAGVPWMPVDVKYVYDVVCLFLPVCVCGIMQQLLACFFVQSELAQYIVY